MNFAINTRDAGIVNVNFYDRDRTLVGSLRDVLIGLSLTYLRYDDDRCTSADWLYADFFYDEDTVSLEQLESDIHMIITVIHHWLFSEGGIQ